MTLTPEEQKQIKEQSEAIDKEYMSELAEMLHWWGEKGLMEKIAEIKENEDEKAFDRHCEDKLQNGEIV